MRRRGAPQWYGLGGSRGRGSSSASVTAAVVAAAIMGLPPGGVAASRERAEANRDVRARSAEPETHVVGAREAKETRGEEDWLAKSPRHDRSPRSADEVEFQAARQLIINAGLTSLGGESLGVTSVAAPVASDKTAPTLAWHHVPNSKPSAQAFSAQAPQVALSAHAARLHRGWGHNIGGVEAAALLSAAGAANGFASRVELRQALVGAGGIDLAAKTAVEVALASAERRPGARDDTGGERGRKLTAEDLRQGLMLSTSAAIGALVTRMREKAPGQGAWIEHGRLLEDLRGRRANKARSRSLPLTLALFTAFLVVATHYFGDTSSSKLSDTAAFALAWPITATPPSHAASTAGELPDSFWAWLEAHQSWQRGYLAHGLPLIGGLHVRRLAQRGSHVETLGDAPLCHLNAGDFFARTRPSICEDAEYAIASVWLRPGLVSQTVALGAARVAWEARPDFGGVEVQFVGHDAGSYVFGRGQLRLDASGLLEYRVTTAAFDVPVWRSTSMDATIFIIMFVEVLFCVLLSCYGFATARNCRDKLCRLKMCSSRTMLDCSVVLSALTAAILREIYVYFVHGVHWLHETLEVSSAAEDNDHRLRLQGACVAQASQAALALEWLRACVGVTTVCLGIALLDDAQVLAPSVVFARALRVSCGQLVNLVVASSLLLIWFALSLHLLIGATVKAFHNEGAAIETLVLSIVGHASLVALAEDVRIAAGAVGTVWLWMSITVMTVVVWRLGLVVTLAAYLRARREAQHWKRICLDRCYTSPELSRDGVAHNLRKSLAKCNEHPRHPDGLQHWPAAPPPAGIAGGGDESAEVLIEDQIHRAMSDFGEAQILQLLEDSAAPGSSTDVSSAMISEALQARTWIAQEQVDLILRRAGAYQRDVTVAPVDALRLFSRLDVNVHFLLLRTQRLAKSLIAIEHRGAEPPQVHRPQTEDDVIACSPQLPLMPARVHARPKDTSGAETVAVLDQAEQFMQNLDERDVLHCNELEDRIGRLAHFVDEVEDARVEKVMLARGRFEILDEAVDGFVKSVLPLYKVG